MGNESDFCVNKSAPYLILPSYIMTSKFKFAYFLRIYLLQNDGRRTTLSLC